MPIPILKMKGLRRTPAAPPAIGGTGQAESASRVSHPPDDSTSMKGHSASRSIVRPTSLAPSTMGVGGLQAHQHHHQNPQGTTSSNIPHAFKGKETRSFTSTQPPGKVTHLSHGGSGSLVSHGGPSVSKQSRSLSYANPKTTTSHFRPVYRSHVGATTTNLGPSNIKAPTGTTTTAPSRASNSERPKKYMPSRPASSKPQPVNIIQNTNNLTSFPTYCGDTNSNRSSIISNCSSIPARSSSSSNRNSSSSISSNFSVGSWSSSCGGITETRELCSYPGAGVNSDTFPRNSSKRSNQSDELMAKSMDSVDHRTYGANRESLQKITNRTRLREPQRVSHAPATTMSASESSITTVKPSRNAPSSSHTSDPNLVKTRGIERQQEGRHSLRSIPKPTATVRGKSKVVSSIIPSQNNDQRHSTNQRASEPKVPEAISNGSDQRHALGERRFRGIPQSHKRTIESKPVKDNVALVPPFASSSPKEQTEVGSEPLSGDTSPSVPPEPPPQFSDQKIQAEKDKFISSAHDTLDEDDGYSSVVNTDHHEDDDDYANCSSDTNSRCESDEPPQIEPMKPLEGISSYSFLQNFRARRSYPYCDNSSDDKQRNSVPVEMSKWQFDEQRKGSNLSTVPTLSTSCPTPLEEKAAPPKDMNPYSLVSSKAGKNPTRPLPSTRECETSESCAQMNNSRPNSSLALSRTSFVKQQHTERSLPYKHGQVRLSEPSSSSRSKSLDCTLISPSDYATPAHSTINTNNPNWLPRNTIAGISPIVTPNRKYTMVPDRSFAAQSGLPALSTQGNRNVAASEPRPVSLDSSSFNTTQKFPPSACSSPLFYRSGSLRSTARLLAHTPPPPQPEDSQVVLPCLKSPQSFVRGSPKYSTVIPCSAPAEGEGAYTLKGPTYDGVFIGGSAPPSTCITSENVFHSLSLEGDVENQLAASREKVFSLSEQLASSNKLVTAYEHSLTNMTRRLHQLTVLVEKKETEVLELRKMIERTYFDGATTPDSRRASLKGRLNRGVSVESLSSLASHVSISSEVSSTSLVSSNSFSSCDDPTKEKSSKKRNWFRNSFSKAFKRREKRKRSDLYSHDPTADKAKDEESLYLALNAQNRGFCSLPSSPLPMRMQNRLSDIFIPGDHTEESDSASLLEEISRLKKLLIDKDSALTESRLESLSSGHQIESLKESIQKLSSEINSLKLNTTEKSPNQQEKSSDQIHSESPNFATTLRPESPASIRSSCGSLDEHYLNIPPGSPRKEGRRVKIYVEANCGWISNSTRKRYFLNKILVANKTSWAQLDSLVCHSFLDHLKDVDADLKLSLSVDAILHYEVGELTRTVNFESPELLPFGYLVGEVDAIKVILKNPSFNSVDSLSFETLIPKTHLQRYIGLLKEHRRVILEGPEGVGKSYLAQKMAEFIVQRLGIEPSSGNIAKFHVNDGTEQDLTAYLSQLSDLCESKSSDLPLVIILESLEGVQKLPETLSASLRVPHDQCPFIIGTCRHIRNRKSELLQLSSNFRWISLNPNFDPIRDLLTRICRRHSRAINGTCSRKHHLDPLLEWLPRCLDKVNAVLSSSLSVGPIGPGVLLPFPEDLTKAEIWFYDVWTKKLLPYLQKTAEDASFIPNDLASWKELDTCLREELPWCFSEENVEVSLPQMPQRSAIEQ